MVAERPLVKFVRALDGPWRVGVGATLLFLGIWLASQPITSLSFLAGYVGATLVVIGVGDLLQARERRSVGGAIARTDLARVLMGVLWVVLGVGAILLPGRAATALPLVLAVALAVSGVLRIIRSRRLAQLGPRTRDERWAAALLALAEIVSGTVVLAWPDVTLVVAAVAFGLRAAVVGAQLCWDAVVSRRASSADVDADTDADTDADNDAGGEVPAAPKGARGRLRRIGKVGLSAAALAVALAVAVVSTVVRMPEDAPLSETELNDGGDLTRPGSLVGAVPFEREVPQGAEAWKIRYSTVDQGGEPVLATALVVVPTTAPLVGGRPVVAWAHGTTGQARQCAPSLLDEPFTAGGFPEVMDEVIDRGWGVVAPDYVGLGGAEGSEVEHAYLVGEVAGTAVLDAVRAARELEQAELSDDTVVWGHSQGGAAALWTAQVQAEHAPDVPLLGTVAMAPATDMPRLAAGLEDVMGGSVFASFVAAGYATAYDDVELREIVRPAAVPLVAQMASRCLTEAGTLASALTALAIGDEPIMQRDALRGPLGERLSQNVPTRLGTSPVLVAQGADDALITPAIQGAWANRVRREASGSDPDYRVYDGLDHMTLVQEGSEFVPELLAWTSERFAGR